MKNNLLYFLLFLSFNLSSGQVIDLNLLIKENKTLTDSFQDYLTSMNFKLYQTKVNSPQKIDTIVFVNKENVEVGIVKTKKTTDIYMNQINESYFKTIQDQLHNNKFMLISSKTQMNNSILKTYIYFTLFFVF